MRLSALTVVLLALGLGACGSINDTKQADANDADVTARAEKFSQLPKAAILAVPVDANGNELTDKAELRVTNADVDMNDVSAIANAFNGASAPASVVNSENELDGDSSTQSWHYWGYNSSWRYNNWCYWNYRPTVYYASYSWSYRSVGYGYYNSYRYYGYSSYWY